MARERIDVLRGYIDCVTTLGYLEGWAFDTDEPVKPLEVSVQVGGAEVAWGLAHRFRTDLMEASLGVGWCAFRLRLDVLIADVRKAPARLVERRSGAEICVVADLALLEDSERPVPSIEGLLRADPTILSGVWQLKQCEQLLMTFISQQGLETFLSVAYAYMLGRPLDEAGLTLYTRRIRQATLTPVGVLEALEKSAEFQARPRPLAAPSSYNFPFHPAS